MPVMPGSRRRRTQPPDAGTPDAEASRFTWCAMVLGDGRILPIIGSLGRRQMLEVPPESPRGKRLLNEGRVRLCWEDGRKIDRIPAGALFDKLLAETRTRSAELPSAPGWARHHDSMARSIGRMKKRLTPG